jgi:hypothetical protein
MPETEVAARVPDHRGHLPGYLDGASAVDAAQKLIDGGLLDTPKAQAAPEPVAAPAAQTQAAPEVKAAPETNAEAQEEGYASLDDYLTKAAIEPKSFYSLPVKAKVDGKELDVPLADLVKSYQLDQHLSAKSNAFAEERRAWPLSRESARSSSTSRRTFRRSSRCLLLSFRPSRPDYWMPCPSGATPPSFRRRANSFPRMPRPADSARPSSPALRITDTC